MLTCVDEKNEKSKQMIKKKVGEYLERAEKIKDHLSKTNESKDGKKAASANGIGSGGKTKYSPQTSPPQTADYRRCMGFHDSD